MIRHMLNDVVYPTKEKWPAMAGQSVKLAIRSNLVFVNNFNFKRRSDDIVCLTIKFNKRGVRTTNIMQVMTSDVPAEFTVYEDLTNATQAKRDYVAWLFGP